MIQIHAFTNTFSLLKNQIKKFTFQAGGNWHLCFVRRFYLVVINKLLPVCVVHKQQKLTTLHLLEERKLGFEPVIETKVVLIEALLSI